MCHKKNDWKLDCYFPISKAVLRSQDSLLYDIWYIIKKLKIIEFAFLLISYFYLQEINTILYLTHFLEIKIPETKLYFIIILHLMRITNSNYLMLWNLNSFENVYYILFYS